MNASVAWFKRTYAGCRSRNLLIHPARKLGNAAAFLQEVEVVRKSQLETLGRRVRSFFGEFRNLDFADLAPEAVQKCLEVHELGIDDLLTKYGERAR